MTDYDMVIVAIFAGIWLVCGLAAIVILTLGVRKPPNDMDRRLSQVDEDIELAERERAARWMGGGFRP